MGTGSFCIPTKRSVVSADRLANSVPFVNLFQGGAVEQLLRHVFQPRMPSIDNEQPCPRFCKRTVRLGIVGNLIAHAGFQDERSPVLKFGMQFTLDT